MSFRRCVSRAVLHRDVLRRLFSRGSLPQDLDDDVDEGLLILGGEALLEVLDDGVERGDGLGAVVEQHDDLGLGQVVGAQALEELGDALGGVGDGVVAKGAGARAEVLEGLGRLVSMNDAFLVRCLLFGGVSCSVSPLGVSTPRCSMGVV